MTDISPIGTIAALDTSRRTLLAFEVRAKIAEDDMEWMARRVEEAFDAQDVIDILLLMRNYEGAELGSVFNATVIKAQGRSVAHVRRYAVVGAPAWAKAMINLFSPLIPVEAKTFQLEDEAAAWRWVDEKSGEDAKA